jgi:hypothetical protein
MGFVFRNLFLVRVVADGPLASVVHADELSSTTIVPVADTGAAVAVVRAAGPVDLIELYGGLGFEAAAAVLAVAPGVPVGFTGAARPAAVASAVLFEDPGALPAHRWRFGPTTVMAVGSRAEAPAVAGALVAEGTERVELCGGMGPVTAAEVATAVDVPVAPVLFGAESLRPAADYQARYAAALSQNPNG